MSVSFLRWSDPATAAAWFELRDLAPSLVVLTHCPVPDDVLRTVLDWIDELALPDAGQALSLARLVEVLPAIAVGFLGAHAYASRPDSSKGCKMLELYNQDGCGRVVGQVLPLVSRIAMALHGEEGNRLVESVDAGLVGGLMRLQREIKTR